MSREERRAKIDTIKEQGRRQDARRRNLWVSLAVTGVFVLAFAGFLVLNKPGEAEDARVVRPDSHRLQTAADGKVTLVEFLDFECEACREFFPVVEDLRKKYAGKVTFVARYFPIDGHFNAERAARAVEAAARQGRFEAMYRKMYETQTQWGEKKVPADPLFRSFAQELKLDVAAWDKAYADPATLARVRKDADDGTALGVQGTPTFFLNGQKIQPRTADEFKAAIDAALAR